MTCEVYLSTLGRKNGSLNKQRRLAGRNAEGVPAQVSLLQVGLLTWAAPVSWMPVFDCAKQDSPPSAV